MLYSGRDDDHHSRGVAIVTTKEVHKCLIGWKPISERIVMARYNSVYSKITISCYAPIQKIQKIKRKRSSMKWRIRCLYMHVSGYKNLSQIFKILQVYETKYRSHKLLGGIWQQHSVPL